MRQSWFAGASAGRTGADGTFAIDTLDENMEFLTAMHAELGFATIPVDFSTLGEKKLRIVLSAGAVIRGTLTVGGAPGEGAEVRFFQEDVEQTVNTNAVVYPGGDGAYRFKQMIPGRYRVVARIPQAGAGLNPFLGRIMQSVIELAPDETVVVDFPFDTPIADIFGVVTVGGAPAGAGEIHLTVVGAGGVNQYTARFEPGGTYIFKGVPAGQARAVAMAGGASTGLMQNLAASAPVEFAIENGPVVELDIDVGGGRTVICDVSGLYADENFLSIYVVEGDYSEGERFAPFGDRIKIATLRGEPGEPVEIHGLRPGAYTAVVTAVIMTPQYASRGARTQLVAFDVPDDGSLEPLILRIPF